MASRLTKEAKQCANAQAALEAKGIPLRKQEIVLVPKLKKNLFSWSVFIRGPRDSPYEGGRFELHFQLPSTYPHHAPKCRFVTPVCHPNVHFSTGEICLDVLKDAWTPVWTLESVARAIIVLLSAPEASSPLNCDAGNLIRAGDLTGFNNLARMYTLDCADIVSDDEKDNSEEGQQKSA